jgi:hypothetical protein
MASMAMKNCMNHLRLETSRWRAERNWLRKDVQIDSSGASWLGSTAQLHFPVLNHNLMGKYGRIFYLQHFFSFLFFLLLMLFISIAFSRSSTRDKIAKKRLKTYQSRKSSRISLLNINCCRVIYRIVWTFSNSQANSRNELGSR